MAQAHGVRLIIEVNVDTECRIEFKEPVVGGEEPLLAPIRSGISRSQLSSLRAQFRRALDALRRSAAEIDQPLSAAVDALAAFHKAGRNILRTLFDFEKDGGPLDAASTLCRQTLLPSDRVVPPWHMHAPEPRLVELRCAVDLGLSLEMLPLLGPFVPNVDISLDGLAALASDFLSFSAIVHRGRPMASNSYIENDPRLPVRLFSHSDIHHTKSIRDYFRTDSSFELDRQWPKGTLPSDIAAELAGALWDHAVDARGEARDPPIQINHFCCHCDEEQEPAAGGLLRFRSNLWNEREVSLERLQTELRERMKTRDSVRPLVFLNACAGADVDPSAVGSFSSLFSGPRFMGFIGTEAVIPDAFAFQLSKAFYEALLDGEPIGSALFSARWAMLKNFKNPLGLVYSLRVDPDIQVRKPRQPSLEGPPPPHAAQ